MRGLRCGVTLVLSILCLTTSGEELRQVPIRVQPPQPLAALTFAAGGQTVSVPVRNGRALVRADLPLPWTVAMARFEAGAYTADDLRLGHTLLVRELSVITGKASEGGRPLTNGYSLLLKQTTTATLDERRFGGGGTFEARVPAGTYSLAINGETCATRVRPGVVVRPGAVTDVQEIACAPTSPVLFRVIDAKTKTPVAGANVVWDPPAVFNADDSRVLFSRRWSTITDRRGVATLRVGPMPIPVRWRVEAPGYAVERSVTAELHDQIAATLRDVPLRMKMAIRVRVHLPTNDGGLRGGYLIVGERADEHSKRYKERERFALRDEVTVQFNSYGDRRLSVAGHNGRVLFYQDVTIDPMHPIIDLFPRPIEIWGRVTRARGETVSNATVINSDPQDPHVILGQATTGEDGSYSLKSWQRGELLVYVVPPSSPGKQEGGASKRVSTRDDPSYELNFEVPGGGASVTVVDTASNAPVQSRVAAKIKDEQTGHLRLLNLATDENGKLQLTGWPAGEADLDISANGYRSAHVNIGIRADGQTSETVRLERSPGIVGRVVDGTGMPVSHAEISAGYDEELGLLARFETMTDGDGHFAFDSPPDPGTLFYVVAAGHALAVVTLDETHENVVALPDLGKTIAYLTVNDAPPAKVYRVVAAPRGESLIPLGVLHDLGEANGMPEYQLLGSHHDGAIVLPEFLGPGAYDFFITRRAGNAYVYDRAGSLVLPLPRPAVLNVKLPE